MWDESARWIPIVVSTLALVLTGLNWRRTTRLDQWQHAEAVSVHETFPTGEITRENHAEVVVRNDGNRTVQVVRLAVAYGNWWIEDRNRPETWALIPLPNWGMLPPGAELRASAPDPVSNTPYVGPVVTIEDVHARRWVITTADRRPASSPNRPPRRRDSWFEKRSWWQRVDERLTSRAARAVERSPGRWHPVPIALDLLWGWRPGAEIPSMGPRKQPRAWRYANGAEWSVPAIDTQPRYSWDPTTRD